MKWCVIKMRETTYTKMLKFAKLMIYQFRDQWVDRSIVEMWFCRIAQLGCERRTLRQYFGRPPMRQQWVRSSEKGAKVIYHDSGGEQGLFQKMGLCKTRNLEREFNFANTLMFDDVLQTHSDPKSETPLNMKLCWFEQHVKEHPLIS